MRFLLCVLPLLSVVTTVAHAKPQAKVRFFVTESLARRSCPNLIMYQRIVEEETFGDTATKFNGAVNDLRKVVAKTGADGAYLTNLQITMNGRIYLTAQSFQCNERYRIVTKPKHKKLIRAMSSGQVGCAPSNIEISKVSGNTHQILYSRTATGYLSWQASCKGKQFWCSAINGSDSHCARAIKSNSAAANKRTP